jgi:ABC-2 type transport system ATP-binding protein
MRIELTGAAKRYRREWVLRDVNLLLAVNTSYAVVGPNGAGKSTLLRMISGYLTPSKGKISFDYQNRPLPVSEVYRYLSYAAPYMDLIEEFTLEEALEFQQGFKPYVANLQPKEILTHVLDMNKQRNKPIRHFSSGMKQRLKLALAVCADTPILLLDEPTTNLDRQGAAWYNSLLSTYHADRVVVIASNVEEDVAFCTQRIEIQKFK